VSVANEAVVLGSQTLAAGKVKVSTVTIGNPHRVRLETILVSVGFDDSATRWHRYELGENLSENVTVFVTPLNKVEEVFYCVACHTVFLSLVV
jgi:hypothetical protein